MKKILITLAALCALAAITLLIIGSRLGTITKTAVNHFGPDITQTTLTLEDATISPLTGAGELRNLNIGNPAGWQSAQAFRLGHISLKIQPGSLLSDHIVIDEILIDGAEVTYETKLLTSNLQDLLKNIQKSAAPAEPDAPAQTTPAPTAAENAKPLKLEIRSFRFQNARITIAGAGLSAELPMPTVVMENLGTKEGGLTPAELSRAVLKEVTAQALKAAVATAAERGLLNKASGGLKKLLGGEK